MCIRDRNYIDNNIFDFKSFIGDEPKQIDLPLKNKKGKITCLLYTSDAADERSSVDLGGSRIIKKKQDNEFITILHPY